VVPFGVIEKEGADKLMNVHRNVKHSGVKGGKVFTVDGDYLYCHYMQVREILANPSHKMRPFLSLRCSFTFVDSLVIMASRERFHHNDVGFVRRQGLGMCLPHFSNNMLMATITRLHKFANTLA